MRGYLCAFNFLLVLWATLGTSPLADASERSEFLPDRTTGEINGRLAVTIVPVKYGNEIEFLNPAGLEAHLSPGDNPNVELVFPCGSWYQPPRGGYRYWIQGGWRMSAYSMMMYYAGEPFQGRGMVLHVPIGEAGRVILPPSEEVAPNLFLRLLHAGSYLEGEFPRLQILRRKPTQELGEGILMPAGPTIGALWDERSQSYVAVSRPL